jgi:hypothetical protein
MTKTKTRTVDVQYDHVGLMSEFLPDLTAAIVCCQEQVLDKAVSLCNRFDEGHGNQSSRYTTCTHIPWIIFTLSISYGDVYFLTSTRTPQKN